MDEHADAPDDSLPPFQSAFPHGHAPAGIGMWRWVHQRDEFTYDAGFSQLFGLEAGSVTESFEDWLKRVDEADRDRVRAFLLEARRRAGTQEIEYKIRRRDGTFRILRDRSKAFINDAGQTLCVTGVALDITGRIDLQTTQDAFADRLHETGKSGVDLAALSHEELLALNRELRNAIEERARIEEELQAQTEELQCQTEELFSVNEELRITNEHLSTVSRHLEESERQYRGFVENLQGISFRGRLDAGFAFAHGQVQGITGLDPETLSAGRTTWRDLTLPEDRPRIDALLAAAPDRIGRAEEFEHRIQRPDGSIRWIRVHGRWLPGDSPKRPLLEGVAYDHTEARQAQEALGRERWLLRTVLDATPDLVFIKDYAQEGRYIACNQAFTDFVGLTRERIMGATDFEVFPEAVATFFREQDRIMFETGESRANEEWVDYPDGRRVLLETLKSPVDDEHGRRFGLIGVSRDITARHQAEETARRQEARFTALFDQAPLGIFLIAPDGVVRHCNRTALRMIGREAMPGEPLYVWDFDPTPAADPAHIRELHAMAGESVLTLETTLATPSGESFPAEVTVGKLEWGGESLMLAMASDIRDRQEALEAMRASEERYQAIFHGIQTAAFVAEMETGRIIDCNEKAEELLGRRREAILGMHQAQLHPPAKTEKYRNIFREHGAQGRPCHEDLEVIRADGTIVPVNISSALMTLGGKRVLVGLFTDMSERRELENQLRQSEKMQAVGLLAGGVAHDFNNQLVGVLGYASLLATDLPEGDHRRYAEAIVRGARRAADLTQQLLAFARKGRFVMIPVDLHQLIGEVVEMLGRSIDKRIVLRQELEAPKAATKGDPTQLQSALLNVAINAADAMPTGGTLTFATTVATLEESSHPGLILRPPPGAYVRVRVADTGGGMSAELLGHIFEPFYTTKAKGKGTGMGLASVYGTVEAHGGGIGLQSEPEAGTTFDIYLPRVEVKPPTFAAPASVGRPRRALRILVVDDEEMVREVARAVLTKRGHGVTTCEDGKEAIRLHAEAEQPFDVVVLDMVMPVMNGEEAFAALRAREPGIRVILSSGYTNTRPLEKSGYAAFVAKPFLPEELIAAVERVAE